ncbi:hypothetical protein [Patulibacter sp.]|uniref:hypothetical protein n=1 Tax=Patulibacter sp. TaxID=1912859 RepID=UPI0027268B1B|nr:hypothetical protein [Patulibacter sp.]MDO9407943.1 hypothetical protein [Patulibacter sp.]
MTPTDPTVDSTVRDAVARAVGVLGMAGIGLVHLLDAPGKYTETPYMFWMYIALILAAIAVGAELLRTGSKLAWAAAAGLAGSAIVGYVLTRTTGLPQDHGDVGNWTEGLGLASLWIEGCVVALAGTVLAARATVSRRGPVVTPARVPHAS